jgi:hypothetical protein
VALPHATVEDPPEDLSTYHFPAEGRNTARSLLPSPSKSATGWLAVATYWVTCELVVAAQVRWVVQETLSSDPPGTSAVPVDQELCHRYAEPPLSTAMQKEASPQETLAIERPVTRLVGSFHVEPFHSAVSPDASPDTQKLGLTQDSVRGR